MNIEPAHQPTGFRRLSFGALEGIKAAEGYQELPKDAGDKPYRLLSAFKKAAPALDYPPRLVMFIDYLFALTQPQDWKENAHPIVWPSNTAIASTLGLGRTQVKALIRTAIAAGLMAPKDSPNGKRYGRRDREGRIAEAYGFDLAPLGAAYQRFLLIGLERQSEHQLCGLYRRRCSVTRNGLVQILAMAAEHGLEHPALTAAREQLASYATARQAAITSDALRCFALALDKLRLAAFEAVRSVMERQESDPLGADRRPLNITTTESQELKLPTVNAQQEGSSGEGEAQTITASAPGKGQEGQERHGTAYETVAEPHELVQLVPGLRPYLIRPESPTGAEIVDAAWQLKKHLGISDAAWREACGTMGRYPAALCVAIIATKQAHEIRTSPGGYFRGMLARHRAGQLQLGRTIWKLRRAYWESEKLRGRRSLRRETHRAGDGEALD